MLVLYSYLWPFFLLWAPSAFSQDSPLQPHLRKDPVFFFHQSITQTFHSSKFLEKGRAWSLTGGTNISYPHERHERLATLVRCFIWAQTICFDLLLAAIRNKLAHTSKDAPTKSSKVCVASDKFTDKSKTPFSLRTPPRPSHQIPAFNTDPDNAPSALCDSGHQNARHTQNRQEASTPDDEICTATG